MKNITFLGLGAMGSRMAQNLINQGYNLSIWNRSLDKCKPLVEQGARQYSTPKEAVSDANVVIAMLSDDEASREVWLNKENGALEGLKSGTIAIECSTLSLGYCLELSSILANKSISFLDAPVVGSRPQAEACQLIYLVGGDDTVLEKSREILNVNSSAIHYVGKAGSGMSIKLVVNGLFGVQVAALSEMLGMLNQLDIDKAETIKLLNKLPITSPALQGIGLAISESNFAPLFPIKLVEKDFSYLLQLSETKNSNTPVANAALEVYRNALKSGFGDDNISGLAQLYL